LDLKRLYGNCRTFRMGKRRGQTPYALMGRKLPTADGWMLLKTTPEQPCQQLSPPKVAV
jgi:hypothetical protein